MSDAGRLYEFAFRGLLAEQALDDSGRLHPNVALVSEIQLAELVALSALDEDMVTAARRMSIVYTAIAAFERAVRKLVTSALLDGIGEDWWGKGVSQDIKRRSESRRNEEEKVKWHGLRGASLLEYTELGDLGKIIRNNWPHFEAYMPSIEWADSIFSVVSRSRNVIMHSGELSREDVARVGINIRDWIKQVGA
jgi:hypothetical protein